MKRFARYLTVLALMPALLFGQAEVQYRLAVEGYRFDFPRDHGAHPEFKLEWWYYTGHLRSPDGREFGYELTFFRSGMDRVHESASAWTVRDLYMTHFAVTDIKENRFYYFEKINRGGPGIAGAASGTLNTWNENWSARLEGAEMKLTANSGEASIDLRLKPSKAPAIQGANGVSQKAEGRGHASHYYSMTRLRTEGVLTLGGVRFNVAGESWMDHEFGTNQLAEQQVGWDWFGIQLDNGIDLMLYRMRNRDGTIDAHSSATVIERDSKTQRVPYGQVTAVSGKQWKSPKTAVSYPIEWTISIPSHRATLRVTAVIENQELVTTRSTGIAYWEGAVDVDGTWEGKTVKGRGYLELTGYADQYRPKI